MDGGTVDGVDISMHVSARSPHHEAFTGLRTASSSITKYEEQIAIYEGTGISIDTGIGYFRISGHEEQFYQAGNGLVETPISTGLSEFKVVPLDNTITINSSGVGVNVLSGMGLLSSYGIGVKSGHGISVDSTGVSVDLSAITGRGLSHGEKINLGSPSSVGVGTQNSVGASNHSHHVVTSSNPGGSSQILATDVHGGIKLGTDTLAVDTLRQSVWINSGAPDGTAALKVKARRGTDVALVVEQTSEQNVDVMRVMGNNGDVLFLFTKDGSFRSGNYVSGASGVHIDRYGYLEVNNARIRGELRATVFTADENHAIGSTVYIRQSAVLYSDLIIG